jgi:hypothetical protein
MITAAEIRDIPAELASTAREMRRLVRRVERVLEQLDQPTAKHMLATAAEVAPKRQTKTAAP